MKDMEVSIFHRLGDDITRTYYSHELGLEAWIDVKRKCLGWQQETGSWWTRKMVSKWGSGVLFRGTDSATEVYAIEIWNNQNL